MKALKAGSVAAVAFALVAVLPRMAVAQQGPAALSVPHPLPPPIATLPQPPRDLYQQAAAPARPTMYAPGHMRGPFSSYGPFGPYPPYGPSMYSGSGYAFGMPSSATPEAARAQGGLRLESSPGSAQVFVDGFYVGLVDEFGISGRALDLDEGAHRVELRVAGYTTLAFDVRITANQTTRYRGDLQRLSPPAVVSAQPAPPAAPRITYLIPHCYAGDRPPSHALPYGCDIAKMIVRKP